MSSIEDSLNSSLSSHHTSFNKNAKPFYPSKYSSPYLLKISNLPESVMKKDLIELVNNMIQSNNFGTSEETTYNVLKFNKNMDTRDNYEESNFAILEILNWGFCKKLIEVMNGYEWEKTILEVKLINDTVEGSNYSESNKNGHNAIINDHNSFFNPYFPNFSYPYDYMYSSTNSGSQYPNYNNASPKGYLSRRSSSKSTDSRKLSRNNSFNNLTKPVPPFLMNLVNQSNNGNSNGSNTDNVAENSSQIESQIEPTNEFVIVEDDEGNPIRVNPCRLFIGNIPYSSTWSSLKNFLVSKSQEIEPNNDTQILRVEIPMQPINSNNSSNSNSSLNLKSLNNYQYFSNLSTLDKLKLRSPLASTSSNDEMAKSRGFAIVTTGNKESSEKLIKYLDNVLFEGRSLTVRYDKFPDYNNYVLQQLYPYNNSKSNTNISKTSSVLSNLAFERNSFQHKFYYGNHSSTNNYFPYPLFYNIAPPPSHIPPLSFPQHLPPMPPPPISPLFHNNKFFNPTFEENIQPPNHPPPNFDMPRSYKSKKSLTASSNNSDSSKKFKENHDIEMNDDEKARELVNSFRSLGLSSP